MNIRFADVEIGKPFKWRSMFFLKTERNYAVRDRNSYLFNGYEICQIDSVQEANSGSNATQPTPVIPSRQNSQTQAFARRFWTYSDTDEES